MDAVTEFIDEVRKQGYARGNFLGLLNVLIGRRLEAPDATIISAGQTWRTLASLLKKLRWDKDEMKELGISLTNLPPRDRERFWYAVIVQAKVDSPAAVEAGDRLAEALRAAGYRVGKSPG